MPIKTNTDVPPESNLTTGLSQAEALVRLKQYGYNEVKEQKPHLFRRFISRLFNLTTWLLLGVVVLSWLLHKPSETYIVAGLLAFNEVISYLQERNAASAIEALKQKLQINVKLLRDGEWRTVTAREVVPGDIIRLRGGDFVPADVVLLQGLVSLDQSALTGESSEVERAAGERLYSGSIVTNGEATGAVRQTGSNTFFGKTIELVTTAQPQIHVERVIASVVQWLVVIVAVLLLIAFSVSVVQGIPPLEILPLMLVLLIGAIPVALTVMLTVSLALASKELVKAGVLVTRESAPFDAASMDVLCVDKTGTLTQNKLEVVKVLPAQAFTEDDVLLFGALASQVADYDALDMALLNAARQKHLPAHEYQQKAFIPFSPETRKTEAVVQKGREEARVMKGAFKAISAVCKLEQREQQDWEEQLESLSKEGYRTLGVARADNQNGKAVLVGLVAFQDPPRPESVQVIKELNALGVQVKMLTGDALPIAREIAKRLEMGNNILRSSDFVKLSAEAPAKAVDLLEQHSGVAEVFPEDKFRIVQALQAKGHIVGMTGDGVNDSPALKQAEVGIAVSNATDAAKGAASMVLTDAGLTNILAPVRLGRMVFQRINIWIVNKITRTMLKTCFVVIAFLALGQYVITATSMLILIFMTDFVKISLATDRVKWPEKPAKWNIPGLTRLGVALGIVMTAEACGLLYLCLRYFNISTAGELNTTSFQILLFFALFSIFIIREKRHFWKSMPGKILLLAISADCVLGILLTTFGLIGFTPVPFTQTLSILGVSAFFSFVVNDWVKLFIYSRWPGD